LTRYEVQPGVGPKNPAPGLRFGASAVTQEDLPDKARSGQCPPAAGIRAFFAHEFCFALGVRHPIGDSQNDVRSKM
jgi:hypothetical protein